MDKRKYWESKVKEYEQSGLSMTAYCREQLIAPSTFDHWKRKLNKLDSFVKISPVSEKIELELSNGAKICVEVDKLQIVLGALNAL